MGKSVICISHTTGAAGDAVARLVAKQLRFRYLDEEVVGRAAALGRVSPQALSDAEQRKPALAELFRQLRTAALSTEGEPPVTDQTEMHRMLIRSAIHATADEGRAVIVSHAASFTLGPRKDILRVLVTASRDTRAARLVAEGAERRDARQLIRRSDAGRAAYLKSFYHVSQELPTHYDLVVNTDNVAPHEAAELIIAAIAVITSPETVPVAPG
jgi:cytidylate kinase